MLTKDLLAKALENISGKKIPAGVLAKCRTERDVLKAFNNLYISAAPTNASTTNTVVQNGNTETNVSDNTTATN